MPMIMLTASLERAAAAGADVSGAVVPTTSPAAGHASLPDTVEAVALYELQEAGYHYAGASGSDARPALIGASLRVARGEHLALIGPNGAGKSTLLRLLAGLIIPNSGAVWLDGRPVSSYPRRQLARRIAFLPQRLQLPFDTTTQELVLLGRTPYGGPLAALRGPSAADRHAVDAALDATHTQRFRRRLVQSLSGGEQQRVALAMALAQNPEVLLLDEPTSHLDPGHALSMLDLIASLHVRRRLTIVSVFHDLNLAALYAHRLAVLAGGQITAIGAPGQVLTPAVLGPVFGHRLRYVHHPETGTPQVLPGAPLNQAAEQVVE